MQRQVALASLNPREFAQGWKADIQRDRETALRTDYFQKKAVKAI